jgi:hypothetical protein
MVLRFNLEKLQQKSKQHWDLLDILRDYRGGRWVKLNNAKITSDMFSGPSFLLKPDQLLDDTRTDRLFIVQYLKLAGRRNWQFYQDLGYKFLDLTYYPDIEITTLKYNPLLEIKNKRIHFKYEE